MARWRLTPGQTHAIIQAHTSSDGISTWAVVADKAYDADWLLVTIGALGADAVIPSKENRKQPHEWDRNLVECYFCRIKHFRRIAARYDQLDTRFHALIAVVAAFLWLI